MAPELGGSQISALLESVPGIRKVLRSPVADALVGMIRAGAGAGEFHYGHADELVQYAVRRGLISANEGDQLLAEVRAATRRKRAGSGRSGAKKKSSRAAKRKPAKRRTGGRPVKKTAPRSKRR